MSPQEGKQDPIFELTAKVAKESAKSLLKGPQAERASILFPSRPPFRPFYIFSGSIPETVYLYINYQITPHKFIFILQQLGMDFSKHTSGTTSVKVRQAPGGKSNFSIGWHVPEATKPTKTVATNPIVSQPLKDSNQAAGKTSVKVHNPPGGRSNIIFG